MEPSFLGSGYSPWYSEPYGRGGLLEKDNMRPATFFGSALVSILSSSGAMFTAIVATKEDQYVGLVWTFLLAGFVVTFFGALFVGVFNLFGQYVDKWIRENWG